jgi:hypothetical protein
MSKLTTLVAAIALTLPVLASAQSDPEKDAYDETKLSAERGEGNPTHYAQPVKIARVVRTVYICSQTPLVASDDFTERLKNTAGFDELDLVMVENPKKADILVYVNHIPWTFDYTAYAIDNKTSVHTADARVTAFNGYLAAIELSKEVVDRLKKQREAKVHPPAR